MRLAGERSSVGLEMVFVGFGQTEWRAALAGRRVGVPTGRRRLLPGFDRSGWQLRTKLLGRGHLVVQLPLSLQRRLLLGLGLVEILRL